MLFDIRISFRGFKSWCNQIYAGEAFSLYLQWGYLALRLFGRLNMNSRVQFSWLRLSPFFASTSSGERGCYKQGGVSFIHHHSVMDDPHYLSFLSLSYHISKIEVITSTSYSYCGDPMLSHM